MILYFSLNRNWSLSLQILKDLGISKAHTGFSVSKSVKTKYLNSSSKTTECTNSSIMRIMCETKKPIFVKKLFQSSFSSHNSPNKNENYIPYQNQVEFKFDCITRNERMFLMTLPFPKELYPQFSFISFCWKLLCKFCRFFPPCISEFV